ncbi:hypothetical protein FJV41_40780 [Myxococcus llanfairpwllgwyngyllgogerychwyrndrobwllllantysiliogogogochensis]|uniref:Uncharacterized protein n=1 Tax=Myxococcus llanfairpwllgwyngyllgogerychwyrndrobwllllantysiliogogogochensis TaxID=2590453 RepID=A0A540WMF5_9BACT|nr:hypothetical protein [Myxococcus llanfairpwllgwyngyllgogerychwyrndrobwllllantysiliogogogochensis]TQF10175.1 hypothetical protein FJV41_40780 [Myxococcus llanfairpwllgwyngyllgogerychwyrndrobwllllantysiliogogogochensis]
MSTRISKDASPVANVAAEQARRAAEEAARRAAEEAARRMLEELTRLAAQAASLDAKKPDSFKTAQPQTRGPDLATDGTSAPGTSLASENAKDGRVNCLDAIADFLSLAPAVIRARSEVLFLKDSRPGTEGTTGHVVIRQGNNIYDPTTREWTASETWLKQHPEYSIAGSVPGSTVNTILSAPPGPEREAALARANLPPEIANMVVADTGASLPVPAWLEQGGPPPWMHGAWHHLDATAQASVLNGIRENWSQHVEDMAPAWIRDPSLSPPPLTEDWSELSPEEQRATAEEHWATLVEEEMSLYFGPLPETGVAAETPLIGTSRGWPWGEGSVGEWAANHSAGQDPIAQYLNIGAILNGEGKDYTHGNLCGELSALSVMGMELVDGLTRFANLGSDYRGILSNGEMLTNSTHLETFLASEGWRIVGQQAGSENDPTMKDLDGSFSATNTYNNNHAQNPTPEAVQRILDDGGALMVLVNIDGADNGMLESVRTSDQDITHWVSVVDITENAQGQTYVRVYNPYQNREEVYSWADFKAAWQSPSESGFTYVAAMPPDATSTP